MLIADIAPRALSPVDNSGCAQGSVERSLASSATSLGLPAGAAFEALWTGLFGRDDDDDGTPADFGVTFCEVIGAAVDVDSTLVRTEAVEAVATLVDVAEGIVIDAVRREADGIAGFLVEVAEGAFLDGPA